MSLAVGKRSSSSGEEDRRQWRQSRLADVGGVLRKTNGGEGRDQAPIWSIPPLVIFASIFIWWESNGVVCVTFKFVCFDGIEGKKLADEMVREKRERKKKNTKRKRALWKLEFTGGSGSEKRWKKEKKKRKEKGTCVEEKKNRGKEEEEGNMDEKKSKEIREK